MADEDEVKATPAEDVEDEDLDAMLKKKKKKKKTKDVEHSEESLAGTSSAPEVEKAAVGEEAVTSAVVATSGEKMAWEDASLNTIRDYTYQELLTRVFACITDKHPDLVGGKRFTMRPPQVVREGTKKTVLVNFQEICKSMNRTTEHVLQFFLAELGTDGSIDGSHRLVIKGKFVPKQLESLIKKYMNEYLQCHLCRSYDTGLNKDQVTRLMFIECNRCGARRSVTQVKAGFHATTKKDRKAAKQG